MQSVPKPVGTVGYDMLAGRETGIDGRHCSVSRADRNLTHRHRAVSIEYIDVVARRSCLPRTVQRAECCRELPLSEFAPVVPPPGAPKAEWPGWNRDNILPVCRAATYRRNGLETGALSALSNCARIFTVPVVVSI